MGTGGMFIGLEDFGEDAFKVVDNKLYLNLNADVFKKWSQDVHGNITNANANWPTIKDQAPSALQAKPAGAAGCGRRPATAGRWSINPVVARRLKLDLWRTP